ncbi:MAG: hypothetical protein GXY58_19125 [Planctomycetaceae bacterium]|nr:hypothetical protein [Planctomycetaceae bacterium]
MFSFLHSAEPGSLAEHIRSGRAAASALFTLEQLYDYLVSSLGDGLYIHARGKRWAEIETVLDRMPGASPLDVAIVKTVGLLGAVGQWQQLRATPQVLRLALAPDYGTRETDKATKNLVAQSCLASRRYNNSYALWESSDVDLDAPVRATQGRIGAKESLTYRGGGRTMRRGLGRFGLHDKQTAVPASRTSGFPA